MSDTPFPNIRIWQRAEPDTIAIQFVRPLTDAEAERLPKALLEATRPAPPDFARRVKVEQRLLDAYSGKKPLPTREECRELAHILGIPDEYR